MKLARMVNKDFKYTPAAKTDIRKTFERIRREMKDAEAEAEKSAIIRPMKRPIKQQAK